MKPSAPHRLALRILAACVCLSAVAPALAKVDHMPAPDAAIVAKLLPDAQVLDGGIRFVETKKGTGPLIVKGDRVTALYVGKLLDGTIFNQKRSRSHSYRFEVGANPRQIIRGWEQAMLLMQDGGHYTIAIPSELAYRDYGREGQVPPNTTIMFDMEIIKVERAKP